MKTSLIILPGNSDNNVRLVTSLANLFRGEFDEIVGVHYQHWNTGRNIDLEAECDLLAEKLKGRNDYLVIGKSAGTLVSLKSINDKKISPSKCVYFGVPLKWQPAQHLPLEEYFQDYSTPTLFVQNRNDRLLLFKELSELLAEKKCQNFELKETFWEGHNGHQYEIHTLRKEVLEFLKK